MKVYICILSITSCVLQVSDGKPPHEHKHSHGSPGPNDIYATVQKKNPGGHHHHHHRHCGPQDDPTNVIYADLKFGDPCQGPIYENTQSYNPHRHHQPSDNDPETLYSIVTGPGGGHRGRGGCHSSGHHGGGGYGRYGGENEIGGNDDDNEPTHDYLPFQCSGGRPHGPPPLPPRPPGGHPDPYSHRGPHHPGHNHGNALQRRGAIKNK